MGKLCFILKYNLLTISLLHKNKKPAFYIGGQNGHKKNRIIKFL